MCKALIIITVADEGIVAPANHAPNKIKEFKEREDQQYLPKLFFGSLCSYIYMQLKRNVANHLILARTDMNLLTYKVISKTSNPSPLVSKALLSRGMAWPLLKQDKGSNADGIAASKQAVARH